MSTVETKSCELLKRAYSCKLRVTLSSELMINIQSITILKIKIKEFKTFVERILGIWEASYSNWDDIS